jgi:hypothetical protein
MASPKYYGLIDVRYVEVYIAEYILFLYFLVFRYCIMYISVNLNT